jgi:hypothetical protein
VPATKRRLGYAKFGLERPSLNLSMQEAPRTGVNASHFGIQVASTADVAQAWTRYGDARLLRTTSLQIPRLRSRERQPILSPVRASQARCACDHGEREHDDKKPLCTADRDHFSCALASNLTGVSFDACFCRGNPRLGARAAVRQRARAEASDVCSERCTAREQFSPARFADACRCERRVVASSHAWACSITVRMLQGCCP